jgi:hypothetical protein
VFLDELFMRKLDSKLLWGVRCYSASLIRAPLVTREIVYLLLAGGQGARLSHLLTGR